jgi:hypothetical protein
MDIGSGLGKPNFHASVEAGLRYSVGVEIDKVRRYLSLVNLQAAVGRSLPADAPRVMFQQTNITEAKTLDPFTHVYMFDTGFPPHVSAQIAAAFNASQHTKYLICFHRPKLVLDVWGLEDEYFDRVQTSMSGSNEGHLCYIYKATGKRDISDGYSGEVAAAAATGGNRRAVDPVFAESMRLLDADMDHFIASVAQTINKFHTLPRTRQGRIVANKQAILKLHSGRVLVADYGNHRIGVLCADLQQVSTVAGDSEWGHRDGAAAQAQFNYPRGLTLLPDGRVLMADCENNRIRMLSADLQQVSTVAGDGEAGHRDGASAQAQFHYPRAFVLLPNGCVLVADLLNRRLRVLSADLQQVSTLTNVSDLGNPTALELLPGGRLLVGAGNRIRVLEGFPATLLSMKPSAKPPKKKNQKEKKRALGGGASASGRLMPKRSRKV